MNRIVIKVKLNWNLIDSIQRKKNKGKTKIYFLGKIPLYNREHFVLNVSKKVFLLFTIKVIALRNQTNELKCN